MGRQEGSQQSEVCCDRERIIENFSCNYPRSAIEGISIRALIVMSQLCDPRKAAYKRVRKIKAKTPRQTEVVLIELDDSFSRFVL